MTPQRARAILAVAPDAHPGEIEAAFRRAIRDSHPDRGGEAGRARLLLDARRCLRAATTPAADRCVVVVPAPTRRDQVTAVLARLRPRRRRRSTRLR